MRWIKETLKPVHEDHRRSLTAMFNGEFTAKQIKIIRIKKDSILGNHYHKYRECFYVLKGEAKYVLYDLILRETKKVILKEGDRLIIDPNIAHKALIKKGTIMIEGTESGYLSAEENDQPWEVRDG